MGKKLKRRKLKVTDEQRQELYSGNGGVIVETDDCQVFLYANNGKLVINTFDPGSPKRLKVDAEDNGHSITIQWEK